MLRKVGNRTRWICIALGRYYYYTGKISGLIIFTMHIIIIIFILAPSSDACTTEHIFRPVSTAPRVYHSPQRDLAP